jgi:hypothetical protein
VTEKFENAAKPLKKPLQERILCCDKDGVPVLRIAVWGETKSLVTISVYAYVGKNPRQMTLARYRFDKDKWVAKSVEAQDTIKNNIVLLTAMAHGLSDYAVRNRVCFISKNSQGENYVL